LNKFWFQLPDVGFEAFRSFLKGYKNKILSGAVIGVTWVIAPS
jgi:hypothetical protein